MRYELSPVSLTPKQWDEAIAEFGTKQVFHESGWLDFLERSQGGHRTLLQITQKSRLIGYFCGVTLQKGPFRILGSPLHGWGTPNLGPAVNQENFNTTSFLEALANYSKQNRIDLAELCCDWMEADSLRAAGFRAVADVTHAVQLSTAEEAWANMFKTTRNYVRRAEKNGIQIQSADREEAAREHFEQLVAVFGRKGQVPPYGVERPLLQWRCLQPSGRITVLRALHDGSCIATYVLVHDERAIWGLATASFPDSLDLRPNELIHWRAIEMACQRGISHYDFCGGGDYKKKYGAREVPRIRWIRAYSKVAGLAYNTYGRWHSLKQTAAASIQRLRLNSRYSSSQKERKQ